MRRRLYEVKEKSTISNGKGVKILNHNLSLNQLIL